MNFERAQKPRLGTLAGLTLGLAVSVGLLFLVPEVDGVVQKLICVALLVPGIIIAFHWHEFGSKRRTFLLSALCVFALSNMYRWSLEQLTRIDHHDVTCYYLGGKYASELGPFELYPATVLVDFEHRRWARLDAKYWAQSRDGFERKRLHHALNRGREVRKTHFTKQRWEDFEADVLQLQKEMGPRRFRHFLVDKGFNATPTWIAYARPLIERVPVDQVQWLTMIDAILLILAMLFIGSTFGTNVALWTVFFFCTTISTIKWLIPGSVILRYDWVAALLFAMCFLKRAAPGLASVFVAVAGLLRVFPVVWMFGALSHLVTRLASTPPKNWWEQHRTPLIAMMTFAAVLSVGEIAGIVTTGVEMTKDHATKMVDHTSPEMISSKRPGLAVATTFDWDLSGSLSKQDRQHMREQRPITFVLAFLLLLGFGWVLSKKSQVEAFAYGYVPFFLLSTGTYYYHVIRITLVVNHANQLDGLRHRVSLCFLFALEIFSQLMVALIPGRQLLWTGILSWGLFVYCVGSLIWMGSEVDKERPHAPARC